LSRHRDERGGVAVFTAICLVLLLAFAAMAVDLGMQRVVRRDMQALADVVALDLARELDNRSTQSELAPAIDSADPGSVLRTSMARNGDTLGEDLEVTADWGSWDGTTWDTLADPPTAVRVTAGAAVDFGFAPGNGAASRTAYAASSTSACYRLGSWAAAVRSGDSSLLAPLNDLLGADLDLLSYQGIANAEVSLGQIALQPQIGDAERLLEGSVSAGDLLDATADALRAESGGSNTVAIEALGVLHEATVGTPVIRLGEALHVSPTDTAALQTRLSVLDVVAPALLAATAELSNGEHAVSIPQIQSDVPGVGSEFTGQLYVQQGAQLACGAPNTAETDTDTSQLAGTMGLDFVNLPSLNLGELGTLQTTSATGALAIDLGNAQGRLVDPPPVTCGELPADPDTFSVAVSTSLATYRLTAQLLVEGQVRLLDGLVRADVEIPVSVSVGTGAPPGGSVVGLSVPPNDEVPVATGTDVWLDIDTADVQAHVDAGVFVDPVPPSVLTASVLDSLEAAVELALTTDSDDFVPKTIGPLVSNINDLLVGPIADLLGLRMAGADVYGVSATCNVPALRG
jgi:uncharacterized membrane protein